MYRDKCFTLISWHNRRQSLECGPRPVSMPLVCFRLRTCALVAPAMASCASSCILGDSRSPGSRTCPTPPRRSWGRALHASILVESRVQPPSRLLRDLTHMRQLLQVRQPHYICSTYAHELNRIVPLPYRELLTGDHRADRPLKQFWHSFWRQRNGRGFLDLTSKVFAEPQFV